MGSDTQVLVMFFFLIIKLHMIVLMDIREYSIDKKPGSK